MSEDCPVCRGSRTVRLAHHQPMNTFDVARIAIDAPIPDTYQYKSKDYPCPECTANVSEDRVEVVTTEVAVGDPYFTAYLRDTCARALAHHLIGHISLEKKNYDHSTRQTVFVASIGVVKPAVVALLQQRVAIAILPAIKAVIEQAAANVQVWGSAFDDQLIRKGDAVRLIGDAYRAAEYRVKV